MPKEDSIKQISNLLDTTIETSEKFYTASSKAGEFAKDDDFINWFENRLKKNVIFLSKSDYEEMCLSSLKVLQNFPGTDFGSSRQRDFNQKWADTTRGYLGEKAFQKFLLQKKKIESKLQHKPGDRIHYDKTDIYQIKKEQEQQFRTPNKNNWYKNHKI